MTTFTTKIQQIKARPQKEKLGLSNVVYSIGYVVTGIYGPYKHSVSREIGIGPADPSNFTDIDKLKTDQLLSFMNTALAPDDMRCIQNEIEEAISQQKDPNKVPLVIEWIN
jgi:hypothetical protein